MTAVPTRRELFAALDDPDPNNPLSVAIALATERYASELNEQARRAGEVPNPVLLTLPDTETEAFALEVFMEQLSRMGLRVVLHRTD